ncbi:peptidylprolyl isomerase [Shewanella maritima]|uniref:Peptidyl-prolyl cis-trans isomerase n=1 Tax=Shewanella maritima TaxID=2520507 RepID=A0A411PEJ6_9GAMM|nr:peptidylprolyl isomerase [Shewanella maritima]QBF81830.1 peptidylprolyl isomerase [Shewanella maritima]
MKTQTITTSLPLKTCLSLALIGLLTACGGSDSSDPEPQPVVLSIDHCFVMSTTEGDMTLGIDTTNTPITGQNFIDYVEDGFYDGTIFHRIVNNFVNQGGGLTADYSFKTTNDPIKNESSVGLKNERGTIAMARTQSLDSATAQFFFNIHDNANLDYPSQGGYAVFGKILEGIEIMDMMNAVTTETKTIGEFSFQDAPVDNIVINSVTATTCPAN